MMLAGSATSSRVSATPSATGFQRCFEQLRAVRGRADDHDFPEAGLVLVLYTRAVAVVPPGAQRRGERDACREVGAGAKPTEVDRGGGFARGQQPGDGGPAELFGHLRLARLLADADEQDSPAVDELLGGSTRLAFEPLARQGRRERLMLLAELEPAVRVAGGNRNDQRGIAARPAVGEFDLHSVNSLGDGVLFITPLGGRAEDAKALGAAIVGARQGCNRPHG